ncbi:MAG: 3-methylornithyl-N6-L-lysine dehydrogenase PylD, partial [bacterium]|nr:3-methylornithyl-N6-L-lysine dehydrogenase PylD [bacterium]
PIKSGIGIITGFSNTVVQIVRHISFDGFVTSTTDVAGLAEAVEKGAGIVMMADDSRFMAFNVKTGCLVDNSKATAKGFIAGLDLMTDGLKDKKVMVIGCGPVGRHSTIEALKRGALVSVYDIDTQRSRDIVEYLDKENENNINKKVNIIEDFEEGLSANDFLVEATNSEGVINEKMIGPQTYITAPGMPPGLTPEAVKKISPRLFHDPLQTGVAVMAVEAFQHPGTVPFKEK